LHGSSNSGGNSSLSSVNSASRGANNGGRNNGNRSSGRGRGSPGGCGRGFTAGGRGCGSSAPNSSGQKLRFTGRCQVCFKEGHSAVNCWHRFDGDYVPDEKHVNSAFHAYGGDNAWYTDTGATDHITNELDKLVIHDKYNGTDQIRTASGTSMNINHIGNTIFSTPNCDLKLDDVLHVPSAKKNLVFVHRLVADNNAFLEFHLDFFLIKDQATSRTLLEGKCRGGLYPLPESNREAHSAVTPSAERWHSRLGHPARPIVDRVISKNNLPCVKEARRDMVCDGCQ
jgi:hypothetical protein